jgi:hypothetical protein
LGVLSSGIEKPSPRLVSIVILNGWKFLAHLEDHHIDDFRDRRVVCHSALQSDPPSGPNVDPGYGRISSAISTGCTSIEEVKIGSRLSLTLNLVNTRQINQLH